MPSHADLLGVGGKIHYWSKHPKCPASDSRYSGKRLLTEGTLAE